ncbi:MAG: tyrosine-type recombinase/integrase [Actinobacteria bacterium]|nr:tyrosine-type recombinase/integrase [Actinomycetota bacterium]
MQVRQARENYVRWLLITRDLSPHTIRAYAADIAALERYLGTHTAVKAFDRERLLAFIEDQRDRGLSSRSIRRRASGLRGFSRWLLSQSLLDIDPWLGTTVAVGSSRTLPRALPGRDLNRLFRLLHRQAEFDDETGCGPVMRRPYESTTLLAVALMVATGVRVHEAVTLRWQDVDLHSRSVRVMGKGRRERHVFLPNDWLTGFTRAYLDARSQLGVEHPYLLFNAHRAPLTTAAMRSRLRKVASEAGMRDRVTPHMLRHTAATQLIEAGVDIRYIQRLLGHASLSTTEIYTHVSDHALRRVVSKADVVGRLVQRR